MKKDVFSSLRALFGGDDGERGDALSQSAAYARYERQLYTYFSMLAIVKEAPESEAMAKELTDHVIEQCVKQRGHLLSRKDPEKWLWGIARRVAMSFTHKHYVAGRGLDIRLDPTNPLEVEDDVQLETQLDDRERLRTLKEAMERLSPTQQAVFSGRLEGLTNGEIAVKHGLSPQTVRNQMAAARKKAGKMIDNWYSHGLDGTSENER